MNSVMVANPWDHGDAVYPVDLASLNTQHHNHRRVWGHFEEKKGQQVSGRSDLEPYVITARQYGQSFTHKNSRTQ